MRGLHALALALAGCSTAAGPAATAPVVVEHHPSPRSCKPEAPIAVTLSTAGIDARRSAVVVTATPTRDTAVLEVALALPPELTLEAGAAKLHFADVPAGEPRRLHATVRLDGRRGEVAAIARVPVDGVTMARTAVVTLGAPVAPPVTRTYALPDGELAVEVRP